MKVKPELPVIETAEQATAMGEALHRTQHYDPAWATRVFSGSVAPHFNGKLTLNNELRSMWTDYMSAAERVALVTAYVEERLKR